MLLLIPNGFEELINAEKKKSYLAVTNTEMKLYTSQAVNDMRLLGNSRIPTHAKGSAHPNRPVSMMPVDRLKLGITRSQIKTTSSF